MPSVPISSKGTYNLINAGIGHSPITLFFEALHNSLKSFKINSTENYLKCYCDYNNTLYLDNGSGIIDVIQAITVCDYDKNISDNKSLSTFGCGLDAILLNIDKKNGLAFILTNYFKDNELYTKLYKFYYDDNELKYDPIDIPNNKEFNILNKKTGTIIFTEINSKYNNKLNFIEYVEEKIELLNNSSDDKDIYINYFGGIEQYNDLLKMLPNNINICINNNKQEPIKYINDTDEHIMTYSLYCEDKKRNTGENQKVYLKDTHYFYFTNPTKSKKNELHIHAKLINDEFIDTNKLIKLCETSYYSTYSELFDKTFKKIKLPKNYSDNNYKTYYKFGNNTLPILGASRFKSQSGLKLRKSTMGYLKSVCNFSDISYLKRHNYFNARKTHVNPLDMILEDEWEQLNNINTYIIANDVLLKNNGWVLEIINGNNTHIKLDERDEIIKANTSKVNVESGKDELGEDEHGEDKLGEDKLGEDKLGEDKLGEGEHGENKSDEVKSDKYELKNDLTKNDELIEDDSKNKDKIIFTIKPVNDVINNNNDDDNNDDDDDNNDDDDGSEENDSEEDDSEENNSEEDGSGENDTGESNKKIRKNFKDCDLTKYKTEHGISCFLCEKEFKQYKCKYGNIDIYFEKDHWDGDSSNNSYENLRLLCLNCHKWKTKITNNNKNLIITKKNIKYDINNIKFNDNPLKCR